MAKNINNIHDKYVRESFSDPKRAAASFETLLPKNLLDPLDLSTLEVLKESYMDEKLSEYFSDLVFQVSQNSASDEKIDLVLLFEHKSKPDKYVMIQVGYYIFAHYYKCIIHKKALKPIIPILYYQGKKKWKVLNMADIFNTYSEDIRAYIPNIHHVFVALHSVPNETLLAMKNTMMAVAMIAQKWRNDPIKLVGDIVKILSLFENELEDRNFFHQTFVYILNASEVETDDVKIILESIPPQIKEDIMTTYDLISQKHEQIGIQKKEIDVVLKSYDNGISIALISNITNLSEEQVMEILKENGREI